MSEDNEFSIDESTLKKLLKEKQSSGFESKSWDEWFNWVFGTKSNNNTQQIMEKVVYNFFHENDFDEWISNFALNLNNIWNESSARDLDPTVDRTYDMKNHSAIVIGKGPSLKKNNHLEQLRKSDYKGTIICTDGVLINVLNSGVTPDCFQNSMLLQLNLTKFRQNYMMIQ